MYNFNNILERSAKPQKDMDKNLIYSESDAQSFYRMVKKYYEENPNASETEVYEHFEKLFDKINMEFAKLPNMKNLTIEYNICKFVNENEKERKAAYDKVIKEELEKGERIYEEEAIVEYSSNNKSAIRTITMQGISQLREAQKAFSKDSRTEIEYFLSLSKKEQNKIMKNFTFAQRREVQERVELIEGDEFKQYSTFLKRSEPILEKNLKEEYITSILTLGKRFEQFGLLKNYCKKQEDLFRRLGLKDMAYPLTSEEDCLGVEDLFIKENLEKLSINQLSVLNSFWLNRFTKELESTNKTFFITKNLGILSKIREAIPSKNSGNIKIEIEEEDLKNLYEKMNFLHESMNIIFREFDKGNFETIIEEITEDGKMRRIKKIDSEPILKKIEDEIGEEYKNYFSIKQPQARNEIIMDIDDYRSMENAQRNIYRAKDANMIAILFNLYTKEFSKNWGIVLEKKNPDSKNILLAVDLKGLNMPVRLHIKKSIVENFLKANQNTTKIPIYEGSSDLQFEGTFISTNVLMPACKKQKKAIKEAMANKTHYRRNLIEHLYSSINGDFPEHLKVHEVIKKKGKTQVIKKRPPRRYFDLSTGEIYIEKDKDKLEKIEEKNIKIRGKK